MRNRFMSCPSRRTLAVGFIAAVLISICGCASSSMSHGSTLDQTSVDRIQKGVTTRQQMEDMFGTPDNITIMGDGSGRRTANWSHIQSDIHAKATDYIPIVNMFAGGTQGTTHTETLQAVFKDDIVEDYQYSAGGSNTDMNVNAFTGSSSVDSTPNGAGSH